MKEILGGKFEIYKQELWGVKLLAWL